ncbi:MAG: LysM peptidoglycan-binding domain-containing protein [Bacteroidota bacterium]
MKPYKFAFLIMSFVLLPMFVHAQETEEEMTREEWQNEMTTLTSQKESLQAELSSLETQITELSNMNNGIQSYDDCINNIYSMLGATREDVDNYRVQLTTLTSAINNQLSPKADRQKELDVMKKNKISALPEFFDVVHDQLQNKLDEWKEKPKVVSYNVVKGDCLWNIAKKEEHYSNAFAWPIIYRANRDQIKDPDLIYPSQVFNIPDLTEDEEAKYDKIRRNYKPAPPSQSLSSTRTP